MSDTERRIRERAYQLWEQAGRPGEASETFWYAAQREVEGEAQPVGDRPAGTAEPAPDPVEGALAGEKGIRAARAVATPSARKAAKLDDTPAAGAKPTKRPPRPKRR